MRTPIPNRALLLSSALALTACDVSIVGGGGAGGGSSTTANGGAGGHSPIPAGKGLVSANTTHGVYDYVAYTHYTAIAAQFLDSADAAPACPETSIGPCQVSSCQIMVPRPKPTSLSVGVVTVTGSTRTASLVAPDYHDDGFDTTKFFSPGETISFDVAGGAGVPHQSGTVVAPSQVTLMTSLSTFDRTHDLPLSFSGGDVGKLVITLQESLGDGFLITFKSAVCKFDASAGQGVIPAAVLGDFEPAGPYTFPSWSAEVQNDVAVTAGPWTTTFRSTENAVDSMGKIAIGKFTTN